MRPHPHIQILLFTHACAMIGLVLCHDDGNQQTRHQQDTNKKEDSRKVILCDTNISEWYDISQQFLSTGNLSIGFEAKRQCGDVAFTRHFDNCQLTNFQNQFENPKNLCQILILNYNIAAQLEMTTESIHLLLLAKEEFDESPDFFKSISWMNRNKLFYKNCTSLIEKLDELNKMRNVAEFAKHTFVQNISTSDILHYYHDNYEYYKTLECRENHYSHYKAHMRLPIVVIMASIGLLGNGAFLIMFACHSELRTCQNVLLINLAIADIFNILFNITFKYVWSVALENMTWNFGDQTCKVLVELIYIFFGYCSCSVVALSVQRFYAIMMPLQAHASGQSSSHKCLTFLNVFSVWILTVFLPLPISLQSEITVSAECTVRNFRFCTLWTLIWYGIFPSVIVFLLYTIVATKLARNTKDLPKHAEKQRRARNRSVGVLLVVSVIFIVSYTPPFVYLFLAYWKLIPLAGNDYLILCLFCDLVSLNSISNPIVLYASSKTFRECFRKYFARCARYFEQNISYYAERLRKNSTTVVNDLKTNEGAHKI